MADERMQMQDPREQYPGPPFEKQPQPPPGLAGRMHRKPDHGEISYRGNGRLLGREALVTGGDSGIGRAAAIAFAREGADVAFGYLPSEEPDAQEVVQLITAEGRRALPLPGDITDERFCTTLVEKAVEGLGGLDILVNNAGHQETRPALAEVSSEEFDRTLKTNLYAMFWITKAAQPHLPPGAAVINTASVQAYHPSQAVLAYDMTKAGIVAFTKALAVQMIDKGARQHGYPGSVLDGAAARRRPDRGEGGAFRRERADEASRPARGDRSGLRAAGLAGGQLCPRRGLWRHWRCRHRLKMRWQRRATVSAACWSRPVQGGSVLSEAAAPARECF